MIVLRRFGPLRPAIALAPLLLVAQMLGWAGPVQAQGFLQQLLGLAPSPQSYVQPRALPPRQPVSNLPMRLVAPKSSDNPVRAGRSVPAEGSGSYTTVCVRMCDGFYFPISHRVQRGRFYRDADACRARCGASEARLFYHSSRGDMGSAVDLTGRSYARLPIAFRHRKQLVSGCTCRPEPWSVEAQIRHEGYAIAEGRSVPGDRRMAGVAIVAGSYPDAKPYTSEATAAEPSQPEMPDVPAATDASDLAIDRGPSDMPQHGAPSPQVADGPAQDSPVMRTPRRQAVANASRSRPGAQRNAQVARSPTAAAALPNRKPTRIASAAPASGNKLVWPGDAQR